MFRSNLKERSISTQIFFSLLIVIASWLFFQILSLITGILIFDISLSEAPLAIKTLDNPESINFLKYIQTISSIGMFAVPSMIIAAILGRNIKSFLELDYFPAFSVAILASLLMIFSLPLNNFLTHFNAQLELPSKLNGIQNYFENKEEQGIKLMTAFLDNPRTIVLFVNLFVVAVVPAFAEELFFRGIIQKFLIKWTKNVHIGIIITGIVFALLHFQFLSALPRILQGIILGYIFHWTRSLWIPILAHLVNNTMAVLFYHFYYKGMLGDEMESLGTPDSGLYYAFISLALIVLLLIAIRRRMKEENYVST